MNRFTSYGFIAALLATVLLAGCETAPPTAEKRVELHDKVADSLKQFKDRDPSLDGMLAKAYGYAVFPVINTGAVGVGGSYGRGEVYEQGTMVGFADLSQGSIGAQLGGQSFSELILFDSQTALIAFKNGDTQFDAKATAVAASSGAAANASYQKGVIVFSLPQSGLMFQAAIGGQGFSYKPLATAGNN